MGLGAAGCIMIFQLQVTRTIPEHSFLPPWWDQRARGLGGTIAVPISTGRVSESQILVSRSESGISMSFCRDMGTEGIERGR